MPDNEREKNHKELLLKHDSKLTRKSSLRKPKENNNKESFDDNFDHNSKNSIDLALSIFAEIVLKLLKGPTTENSKFLWWRNST